MPPPAEPRFLVVAYDFGIKQNILRRLVQVGCRVTVVPALTSAADVLALKPDGGEIFVSNFGSDTISEIATGANEVGGSYLMGARPSGGVVSADNSTLWVSNSGDNTVAAYSIDDGQRINTVQVGDGPGPLALSGNGFLLLAVDELAGDISVVRTISYTPQGQPITGSLFTVFAAGKHPNAIAAKSFLVK